MAIDFVVLWVDGQDPHWRSECEAHRDTSTGDNSAKRYRNWDQLHFLFRSFEYFTPWVNKIHFVTWGHLPKWLNINHPKIQIVEHKQILPQSVLPTFNANPLEINLHRIKGLTEQFVYFNDDTFILRPLKENYFFSKGLPNDMCVFNAIFLDSISHIRLNNIQVINRYFNKLDRTKRLLFKIFTLQYGLTQIRSLLLLPWPQITGFYDPHQPQPFLKRTFSELWKKETTLLNNTTSTKFRSNTDVSQYVFRYWQLMTGNFHPRSFRDTFTIPVQNPTDVDLASTFVRNAKYSMLCINDEIEKIDKNIFNTYNNKLSDAFTTLLPHKSSFEI